MDAVDRSAADGRDLESWQAGKEEGLRTIIERHGAMVAATCRRRLGDGADADDVSQAVFLAFARHAARIRRPDLLAPWLHRVAVRGCAQALRARARRRYAPLAEAAVLAVDAAEAEEWASVRSRIDAAVDELPATQRAALIERFFAGRSFAEAGAALGISADATKKRVAAALVRLRQRMATNAPALSVMGIADGLAREAGAAGKDGRWRALAVAAAATPRSQSIAARLSNASGWRRWAAVAGPAAAAVLIVVHVHGQGNPPRLLEAAASVTASAFPRSGAGTAPARVLVKYYDIRDVVEGVRRWDAASPASHAVRAPTPTLTADPAFATRIEAARSAAGVIDALRASVRAGGGRDPEFLIDTADSARADLDRFLTWAGQSPAERQAAVAFSQHCLRNVACIIPPIDGRWILGIRTDATGHILLESALRQVRALRADPTRAAERPWQDRVAHLLLASARLDRDGTSTEAHAPALSSLVVPDGESGVVITICGLGDGEDADRPFRPLLVAEGGPGRGCFVVCVDGLCCWYPGDGAARWAQAEAVRLRRVGALLTAPSPAAAMPPALRANSRLSPAWSGG